jgi:mannose-1-phosphate guanylyltransferase/mannose-6-phosphate isomerase
VVREELAELDDVEVIVEPFGRDTAACVALATRYSVARYGEDVEVGIFPADHYISEPEAFRESVERAYSATDQASIVTVGITPTRPETGYGYIEAPGEGEVLPVRSFREKPNRATAADYLIRGGFYWNAGMFFFRSGEMWKVLERLAPAIATPIGDIEVAMMLDDDSEEVRNAYQEMPSVSVDYAIMEHHDDIAVVPARFGWSDVGTWDSFYELRETDSFGNVVEGPTSLIECRNTMVFSDSDRTVACLGVRDLIVVDADAGVLVMERGRGQEVRRIVKAVEEIEKSQSSTEE